MAKFRIAALGALALAVSACGGTQTENSTAFLNQAAPDNQVSEEPFGATGAPGSDLTDNGATDGASGLADNGQADVPLTNANAETPAP